MALNKLKKWIGTQLFETFVAEYNQNVDATNAAIDLAEQNAANISLLPVFARNSSNQTATISLPIVGSYALFIMHVRADLGALYLLRYFSGDPLRIQKIGGADYSVSADGNNITITPPAYVDVYVYRLS